MGNSVPRKHHTVPAFYLAGFTKTDSRDGVIRVFDQRQTKRYNSTPRKTCRQTDFYRLEEPGVDPNEVENLLSWHEGVVAPFVREVGAGGKVDKKHVGEALSLAAAIAVRGERARQVASDHIRATIAEKLRTNQVTREQWEALRSSELRHGATSEEVPEYDLARDQLLRGEWYPRGPVAPVIGMIPELQESMMSSLHQRDWELHVTDAEANGGFITSDHPVTFGQLVESMSGRGLTFRHGMTEITFPVSRNAALVSYPGARNGNCITTDEVVARVNIRTMYNAHRSVFHAANDFLVLDPQNSIRKGSEAMRLITAEKRRGLRL